MRIIHRCFQTILPQKRLNCADIRAVPQKDG